MMSKMMSKLREIPQLLHFKPKKFCLRLERPWVRIPPGAPAKTPENGEIPGFFLVFGLFGIVKISPNRADFAPYSALDDVKDDVKNFWACRAGRNVL